MPQSTHFNDISSDHLTAYLNGLPASKMKTVQEATIISSETSVLAYLDKTPARVLQWHGFDRIHAELKMAQAIHLPDHLHQHLYRKHEKHTPALAEINLTGSSAMRTLMYSM